MRQSKILFRTGRIDRQWESVVLTVGVRRRLASVPAQNAAAARIGELTPNIVPLPTRAGRRRALAFERTHHAEALLRLGVTYEKGVTLGNVTMSHRTRERPAECLALSHSTMIGLPRAALEN
ncbi:hypothetical protein EVAR_53113_1 [Eumeta japonica]|uniref:Uncharacterized protein n=1 Tax=Eumeta variegata TaxID=151549 RepID=A0A4C1Y821_EUMVA|nr:hypothetical protein EVAR_53113_1 [Eumeta japonica]